MPGSSKGITKILASFTFSIIVALTYLSSLQTCLNIADVNRVLLDVREAAGICKAAESSIKNCISSALSELKANSERELLEHLRRKLNDFSSFFSNNSKYKMDVKLNGRTLEHLVDLTVEVTLVKDNIQISFRREYLFSYTGLLVLSRKLTPSL